LLCLFLLPAGLPASSGRGVDIAGYTEKAKLPPWWIRWGVYYVLITEMSGMRWSDRWQEDRYVGETGRGE